MLRSVSFTVSLGFRIVVVVSNQESITVASLTAKKINWWKCSAQFQLCFGFYRFCSVSLFQSRSAYLTVMGIRTTVCPHTMREWFKFLAEFVFKRLHLCWGTNLCMWIRVIPCQILCFVFNQYCPFCNGSLRRVEDDILGCVLYLSLTGILIAVRLINFLCLGFLIFRERCWFL